MTRFERTAVGSVLGTTGDGMVAVAPGGTILTWNAAAAALLGWSAKEVVGRYCHAVFGWRDRDGTPVCSERCPHVGSEEGEGRVRTREVSARARDGDILWLSVSTLVPPPELRGECRLVHLFREAALPPTLERLVAGRIEAAGAATSTDPEKRAALGRLTAREREVLRLIAAGVGTSEIAGRLALSPITVRNHVQRTLAKLRVGSKLEAAVLLVRSGSGDDAGPPSPRAGPPGGRDPENVERRGGR